MKLASGCPWRGPRAGIFLVPVILSASVIRAFMVADFYDHPSDRVMPVVEAAVEVADPALKVEVTRNGAPTTIR